MTHIIQSKHISFYFIFNPHIQKQKIRNKCLQNTSSTHSENYINKIKINIFLNRTFKFNKNNLDIYILYLKIYIIYIQTFEEGMQGDRWRVGGGRGEKDREREM